MNVEKGGMEQDPYTPLRLHTKDAPTEAPPPGRLPQITVVGSLAMESALAVPTLSLQGKTLGTYFNSHPGGAGFHQTVACARLSKLSPENSDMVCHFTAVKIIGVVGDDYHGIKIVQALGDELVDFSDLTVMKNSGTNMVFAIKDQAGKQATVVVPNANLRFTEQDDTSGGSGFLGNLHHQIPGPKPDVLILQPEMMDPGFIRHMISLANAKNIPVVLAPTTSRNFPRKILKMIDHLVVTELEAQALLDYPNPEADPSQQAMENMRGFLRAIGVKNVVITQRSRGTIFYSRRRLHEQTTRENLSHQGLNWTSFRFAFTAAYAVAVARNKGFNIRAAVHDALEVAGLAAKTDTSRFPELGQLQPSPARFNHHKATGMDRASKIDQKMAETVRKYTGGVGAGLERNRAVGVGSLERPAGGDQGDWRERWGSNQGIEEGEGYGVYWGYEDYQGEIWKRKQDCVLGENGDGEAPSKRLRVDPWDETNEESLGEEISLGNALD